MAHQVTVDRTFGARLKGLRQDANLHQSEVAAKAKVSQPAISLYEATKAYPPLDVLRTMAEMYGADFLELLDAMAASQATNRVKRTRVVKVAS